MAEFKFSLAILIFLVSFTKITVDPLDHDDLLASHIPFHIKLEQITSKISLLEVKIEERTIELRNKVGTIGQMEKIIQVQSDYIESLRSEIEVLQEKRSFDYKEGMAKDHNERKIQVEMDGKEIGLEELATDSLKALAAQSEQLIHELNLKLLTLQNVSNDQKIRMSIMEQALQVMEEETKKTKPEAVSISKDTMVCGDLLQHWLSVYFSHYQSLLVNFLNEQGRPAMNATFQMALKMKGLLGKWCDSYVETINTEWIPNLKDQWLPFTTYLEPHVQNLSLKVIEVYHAAIDSIIPEVAKEVKKSIQSLVKLVMEVTKYHLEKAQVFLMQYKGTLFHARQNFVRCVSLYHNQVQETLKSNNFIKPFATMDLAWFVATALLALPPLFLYKLWSAMSSKKSKKFNSSKYMRRGSKRSHPS